MATTTDGSTLAPSVVGDLSEKIGVEVEVEVEGEGQPGTSKSSETDEDTVDPADYPKPLALGLITMALSLAVFLVALVSFLSHIPTTRDAVFSMDFETNLVL